MDSDPPFVKDIDAKAARGDEGCKAAAKVLQAMRAVICSNRCPVSATAYFAATVTTLQKHVDRKGGPEEAETTSALLLVLRRALPAAPSAAVHSRFNDLAAALASALRTPTDEGLVRQALSCLSVAADIAFDAGSRPNRKVLKPVFTFLMDTRPNVRKQAELTAVLVLRRAAGASDEQTVEFASSHLVQMLEAAPPRKKAGEELPAQRALALLRVVAPTLPPAGLGGAWAALVALPAQLGQHPCCTEAFELLGEHLGRKASGEAEEQQLIALAQKLLPGLLSVPVTLLNVAYVVAFAKALAAAAAVLTGARAAAGLSPEARGLKMAAVKKLVQLFAERDPSLLRGAKEALLSVLTAAGEGGDMALLQEFPELCRPLLGYESKGAWLQALPVIAGLFIALDTVRLRVAPAAVPDWSREHFSHSRTLLSELVQIRDKSRGGELNIYGKELDKSVGAAVTTFGPELVLGIADLQLLQHPFDTSYEQNSRSWMLLVLREHCKRTSLAFFTTHILPLASALKSRSAEAQATSGVVAKKYEILLEQVWALLPSFCDEPLDLGAALLAEGGRFAKQLVSVMLNETAFREHVWSAFTKACDSTREPPSPLSKALQEANATCLKTLSGRVIPEMFSAYTKFHTDTEGQEASVVGHNRGIALGAVQSYARVADPALVGSLFKTLVARLLKLTTGESGAQGTEGLQQAVPLADLANALIPHLSAEFLELALKVFTPMLSGVDTTAEEERATAGVLQRAAYRAVTAVMEHDAAGKIGDASKILGLWTMLRDSRQTCGPPAVKARLQAIQALLLLMQERLASRLHEPAVRQEFLQCLQTLLPEVMMHLRDPGTTVRDAARDCMHIAVTTAIHQDLQAEIVSLISAGLAGLTRHSKASAVDAFSRTMYEHSCIMSKALQDRLMPVVLLLLEDSDAQVWRAALKFTKVVVFVTSKEQIEKALPQILRLFESKHLASAKLLVRSIIERLVKVLPADVLAAAFPKGHVPLLAYVQRQVARQGRPKTVRQKPEGGNEEEEQEGEDAEMGDAEDEPKASWDAFHAEDDAEVDAGVLPSGRRKRTRGTAAATAQAPSEPPTSAVMAHDAVQSLLDAWEAASDGEGEGGGRRGAKERSKRKRDAGEASTWIHEEKDVPLDFMSADAAHSVLTVRPPQKKRQRASEVGEAGAQNRAEALRRSGLRFADDGRLVVSEEAAEEKPRAPAFNVGTDSEKKLTPLSRLAAQRKARMAIKAQARQGGAHIIKGLDTFKPKKKAQGDVKRKGSNLKPYAYVKLNPKVFKEKHKDKATMSFAKVINGSKQSVLKGGKAKGREIKRRQEAEKRKRRRKGQKTAPR